MRCIASLFLLLGALAFCSVFAVDLAVEGSSDVTVSESLLALVDPLPSDSSLFSAPTVTSDSINDDDDDDKPTITGVVPSSLHVNTLAYQGTVYATIHLADTVKLPLEFDVLANDKHLTIRSSSPLVVALTPATLPSGSVTITIRPPHSEEVIATLENAINVYGKKEDTVFLASAVTAVFIGPNSDSPDSPPTGTFAVMGVTASDVQVEVNGDAPTGLRTEEATGRTYFYISYPLCTSLDECLGRKNDIRFIVADDKGSFTTSVPFIHAPFFVAVSPNSYDRSRGADVGVTLSLSEDYRGIHPISITATDRNAVISGATFDRVAKTVFFRLNCAECELGSLGLSPELPTLHPSDVLGSRYFMVIERGDRTPKSGNGLAWEWIVLIVVVPLVVVAVVVYIVLKRRAKARRSEAMAFQAHLYASHGYSDDGYLPA